jgi:hypothetical protein
MRRAHAKPARAARTQQPRGRRNRSARAEPARVSPRGGVLDPGLTRRVRPYKTPQIRALFGHG